MTEPSPMIRGPIDRRARSKRRGARPRICGHARRTRGDGRRDRLSASRRAFRLLHERQQHSAGNRPGSRRSRRGRNHRRADHAICDRGCGRPDHLRPCRAVAHDLGADRGRRDADDRRGARDGSRADGVGDGRAQRIDAPRRKHAGRPDIRNRRAGPARSGPWRFRDPARDRVELAGASLSLGGIDRRRDTRRRRLFAGSGKG